MLRNISILSWLALAAFGFGLNACGEDESEDCVGCDVQAVNLCITDGPIVDITDNHLPSGGDHELIVSADDVNAGVEKVYDIRGDNTGHTHSVTITVADFELLQVGTAITLQSSDTGAAGNDHTHTVEIGCTDPN